QIGDPIDQPLVASAQIIPKPSFTVKDIEKDVYEIIDSGLENITSVTERVIRGELKTF
ncbi:MAG TPA: methionine adenosyltransferase, partial [Methanospirillum sp.]|nr:methionine adenosyltransferase [Methanospirillum sp.]